MKLKNKTEYVDEIFDDESISEITINKSKFNNCSFKNTRLKEIMTKECNFVECDFSNSYLNASVHENSTFLNFDILPARSLTLTNEDSLKELSSKLSFVLRNDSFDIRPSRPSRGCRMIRRQSISSSPI